MFKAISTVALVSSLLAGPVCAAGNYEGTWSGQLKNGAPVVLTIPAGVENGAPASYSYGGQDQGPQTPTMQGKKIRLDNPSGTYIVIGPVKGNSLPYFWTDGSNKANATLSRQ